MGGQACVLYGGAEFSRDTDLAVLCEAENLARLKSAMDELQARQIFVPPLEADYLQRGHAVHFRYAHPDATDLRVDLELRREEDEERARDREYRAPLKRELETLRRNRRELT
jgi:hypothetical protein